MLVSSDTVMISAILTPLVSVAAKVRVSAKAKENQRGLARARIVTIYVWLPRGGHLSPCLMHPSVGRSRQLVSIANSFIN